MTPPRGLTLDLATGQSVSALFTEVPNAFACLVLAHGAGAGMYHWFMTATADGLADRGIATLRYQFPYIEAGSKRVDKPEIAHAVVRAAVAATAAIGPLPLFAGGKSFGARMTSQAQAVEQLPGVRGLVFFGFPLHPAGKPATDRARHLVDVHIPMLFLQGTRDALADFQLIEGVVRGLGATLFSVPDADHSFHVPARSGRTDAQVLGAILDETATWMRATLGFGAAPASRR